MTREEAIQELCEWLQQMIDHGVPNYSAKREALAYAISALSAEPIKAITDDTIEVRYTDFENIKRIILTNGDIFCKMFYEDARQDDDSDYDSLVPDEYKTDGDLISRADAIEVVHKHFVDAFDDLPTETDEDGDVIYKDTKSVNELLKHNKAISKALNALPSADAEPIVIRAKTFMRKEDFDKWAEDIKRQGENIICIPCDAEVVSADADRPSGEWLRHEDYGGFDYWECSNCKEEFYFEVEPPKGYNYCPSCGARMKGGGE